MTKSTTTESPVTASQSEKIDNAAAFWHLCGRVCSCSVRPLVFLSP